jgi:hypothetical protein
MTRFVINYPKTQDDWVNLPKEFTDYLDCLDEVKRNKAKDIVVDPLYPSYDYEWEVDDNLPLQVILEYWNDVNNELPDYEVVVEEINDSLAESAYNDYVSSSYSF